MSPEPAVLLCDYGEVLSLAMPPEDRAALELLAGELGGSFWQRYWQHRRPYDRGELTTAAYWELVLGQPPGEEQLSGLSEADIAGWTHPNAATLAATARAAAAGWRLAVLSNAPFDHAEAYDRQPWLAPFEPRLFSCRLGAVKPEPEIYAAALAELAAEPGEVVFLDDRSENVAAARAAGLRAEVFTQAAQIDSLVAASAGS